MKIFGLPIRTPSTPGEDGPEQRVWPGGGEGKGWQSGKGASRHEVWDDGLQRASAQPSGREAIGVAEAGKGSKGSKHIQAHGLQPKAPTAGTLDQRHAGTSCTGLLSQHTRGHCGHSGHRERPCTHWQRAHHPLQAHAHALAHTPTAAQGRPGSRDRLSGWREAACSRQGRAPVPEPQSLCPMAAAACSQTCGSSHATPIGPCAYALLAPSAAREPFNRTLRSVDREAHAHGRDGKLALFGPRPCHPAVSGSCVAGQWPWISRLAGAHAEVGRCPFWPYLHRPPCTS